MMDYRFKMLRKVGDNARMLKYATLGGRVFHSVPAGTLLEFYTRPMRKVDRAARMFLAEEYFHCVLTLDSPV